MNKDDKKTIDNYALQNKLSLESNKSRTDANFQRFQPLPSIRDVPLTIKEPPEREVEICPSQMSPINKAPVVREANKYRDFNQARENANGRRALNLQYKWLQAAQDLSKSPSYASDFIDHARAKANLRKYTYNDELKTDSKLRPEQKPSFLVRNSKCIRQLPPLQPKSPLPCRPTCPSPVSPPSTPISSVNSMLNQ